MASHLTITSTAPTGVTSSKSFSGSGSSSAASTDGPLGIFGALLAGAAATKDQAGTTAGNGFSFDLGALIKLTLGASGDGTDGQATDPEALAALADGTGTTTDAVVMPQPLVNFIDALTDLKTALDSGKPVDPDLLGKVEDALSGLADALGLDLDTLKAPEDIASLLAGMNGDRPDLAAMLAALLTPIAQTMDKAAGGTTDATALSATSDRLAAIGDKMAALLAALEQGDVAPEKLATLGVAPDQALDPEIEAALNRFAEAAQKAAAATVPAEPELATPALKLSEPVLTGKATMRRPRLRPPQTAATRPTPPPRRVRRPRPRTAPVPTPRSRAMPMAAAPMRAARAPSAPRRTASPTASWRRRRPTPPTPLPPTRPGSRTRTRPCASTRRPIPASSRSATRPASSSSTCPSSPSSWRGR